MPQNPANALVFRIIIVYAREVEHGRCECVCVCVYTKNRNRQRNDRISLKMKHISSYGQYHLSVPLSFG